MSALTIAPAPAPGVLEASFCCVFTLNEGELRACRRPAATLVSVTCSAHGYDCQGICRRHLNKLRIGASLAECDACGELIVWEVLLP